MLERPVEPLVREERAIDRGQRLVGRAVGQGDERRGARRRCEPPRAVEASGVFVELGKKRPCLDRVGMERMRRPVAETRVAEQSRDVGKGIARRLVVSG